MSVHAYKYRIYPNAEQEQKLAQFFGCSRKMYNLLLEWWQNEYQLSKESGEPMRKMPDYTYFKNMEEYSYFRNCDSVALQQSRMSFQSALENFFKSKNGQRKGRKVGFPTFKKKGVSRDAYTTYNNNTIYLDKEEKHIKLPKLGFVKIKLHRKFYGNIKSVNVSRSKANNYFVSITVDTWEPDKPVFRRGARACNPSVVGLDMSYKDFVVSSDGSDDTIIKYVRLYRKYERKLARLQRQVSRKEMIGTGEKFINRYGKEQEIKRRSANREKARLRHARLAEHVANKRTDFLVKLALYFVRKYDVIVLEDIDMQAQARSLNLGKSAMDLGFGEFHGWLEHEAKKYDCYIYYVDKWFASSQTCSECGYKNPEVKDLSVREWTCPCCGAHHDRDRNAALNLKGYFLERLNTVGTTEIQACGDGTSTLREIFGRVLPKSPVTGQKQEAHKALVVGQTEARDLSRG